MVVNFDQLTHFKLSENFEFLYDEMLSSSIAYGKEAFLIGM